MSFTSPHRSGDRRTNNNDNGDNQHEGNQNSFTTTGGVWRGRLNSDHHGNTICQSNMNHRANPKWVNNPRGDHGHRRQTRDNNSVITGTSSNCSLSAATPRSDNPRQSRKDRLFISRLSWNTRAIDVVNFIRNEANLNIRCDPIATRYDTYRSYYIRAHPRHHALQYKARNVAKRCSREEIQFQVNFFIV